MASRAYWSGQIRLSLVSIPVEIVPATKTTAKISFNQIHKPSGSRIRYQKVVPGVGPVENEDIVKGYEIEKGRYVLLSDEEIEDVKLEAKKTIDLTRFVDADEIDSVYFEKPYFIVPDEESDAEAYVVLREALRKTNKIGLGQIVIRGKGSVVAVKACGRGLMMETLHYADEVKSADATFKSVPDVKPEADMIELAEELIERKTKAFDPNEFEDVYEKALQELIDAKAEHRKVREVAEPQQTTNVIDLMEALRRSVGRDAKPAKASARRSKTAASKGKSRSKSARGGRRKAA